MINEMDCIVNINLLNTLVAQKYCVYKRIQKAQHSSTYLAMNINDKNDYIVQHHKLWKIKNTQQRNARKYRILKKAEVFSRIRSPYVRRCFDVYKMEQALIVVYEHLPGQSLASEINQFKIASESFSTIREHMFQALNTIHQIGYIVKEIQFEKVYYKNGFYKIKDFALFLSELNQQDKYLPPQLVMMNGKIDNNFEKCDVWALGLFYLRLIFTAQEIPYDQSKNLQCLFTMQMQRQLTNSPYFGISSQFLKRSLMIDIRDRSSWSEMSNFVATSEIDSNGKNKQKKFIDMGYQRINVQQVFQQTPGQSTQMQLFQKQYKLNLSLTQNQQYQDDDFDLNVRVQKFKFQAINQDDTEIYLQTRINNPQKLYELFQDYTFQAEKSQYIQTYILEAIQKYNLLNLQARKYIQFMYLVSLRCYMDFIGAHQSIKQLMSTQNLVNYDIRKSYEKNISPMNKKLHESFQKYSKSLTVSENSIFSIVKDRFKLILHQQEKSKFDKFLTGVQKIDYTRQEQIDFTCQFYLPTVIEKLKDVKHPMAKKVREKCKIYAKIVNIKKQDEKRGRTVKGYVENLLRQANEQQRKSIQ